MAVYNLFAGGDDRYFGKSCGSDVDLPLFSQPDQRVDGGYGYREKTEWKEFLHRLQKYYGVKPSELAVGDKLRLYLSPNHATLSSLFVDFRSAAGGFEFKLQTVEGLDLSADKYESTYDNATGEVLTSVKGSGTPEGLGGATAAYTQFAFVFTERPHTAKVDAVELEITALPQDFSGNLDLLFVRRFEMDGIQL
ncbi:hypothetical protein [Neisseria animalis]|uniref:Uncharacterized protein n=1 Tax=Neisseria animalis TaxID=492 RepID=A0A5P3MTD5_NEIAN|nr:hypothetical protein [Neisseria animalis]QEY24788.1 hypothetical protein D0T90_10180 [Neisseria animalis]ROW31541.1 hypothetical protein CGZ60_09815 [Neisseria animalis]VEE07709.1 Uncharacterised protein [Neisseria animalis]